MDAFKVFPLIDRLDLNASGYSEPIYSYLNRSARVTSERVREVIETWFSHYPKTEQMEILPRIQSSNDKGLISAFFELYLYQLLNCLGYEITVHPSICEGPSKTPDFLVKGFDEEFYLEAVVADELSEEENRGQKILNLAFDKINEIQSTYFFAHLSIEGNATSPIRSRELKYEISDWFKSLEIEFEQLATAYSSKGMEGLPFRFFDFEGVTIKVVPIPKYLHKGELERIIGSHMHGVRLLNTKEAIRKSIRRKSSRYGKLEKPYILAVNVLSMSCEWEDVMEALFGSEQWQINIDNPTVNQRFSRARDGVWSSSKGTRVSGILLTKSLTPWTLAYQGAVLYLNPWSKFPYTGNLKQLPYAEGKMQWAEGIHPRELLGLPKGWPEQDSN